MSDAFHHPAVISPEELLKDCEIRRVRRSGPGGQHRNKVETGIVIKHRPTGVTAEASERRSQSENRRQAIFRLRLNLALQVRFSEAARFPSPLWQQRCQSRRISVNSRHPDFPALLAEALDALEHDRWELRESAERFSCTSSQLIKFLKLEPRAFVLVNLAREKKGLHLLK